MYFWNSYPFVRLSIALILGILGFDRFPDFWNVPIVTSLIVACLISLFVTLSKKAGFYKLRLVNGLLSLILILFVGGWITKLHYHSFPTFHYQNITSSVKGFSGTIISTVNERTNHYRYDFKLQAILGDSLSHCDGVIHLYVRKDSTLQNNFRYGDNLIVQGSFYPVPPPGNPSEFNYKQYLERQGIFSHAFVQQSQIKWKGNSPPNPILNFAFNLRNKASRIIDLNIKAPRENAIAKALFLGIKDHLDNDIKRAYSAAGAMHVLAVSGLHVGIVYLISQLLLGKLKSQGTLGKRLFGIACVFSIWLYALITGLSPSVLRAATMFTMVAISESNSREGNIYNTLGVSAFLLLIFDPYLIYSVGFQLSYIAVIGIVYLQPKIYRLIDFRWIILDKAWAITCVSVAAQLATFPLSAYYFHQFPTYFLVSNLLVIPSAFIMLISGIIMLIIDPVIPIIGEWIGKGVSYFMWLINEAIAWIETLPNSLITWIYLDREGLFLTYSIIIILVAGLQFRSFWTILNAFFLGMLFVAWSMTSNFHQSNQELLIFYEIKEKTVIDHIRGHSSKLYIDQYNEDEIEILSFQIDPFRLNSHLSPIKKTISSLSDRFKKHHSSLFTGTIAGERIIIFDSTTFHLDFQSKIESDILLIENGSVKDLDWLKNHFNSKCIIIGNKNSTYYSRKMKKQASDLELNLHSLKEDGAFVLEKSKKKSGQMPALFTTNPD